MKNKDVKNGYNMGPLKSKISRVYEDDHMTLAELISEKVCGKGF